MMRPSSACHRGAAVLLAVAMASGCATSLPVARVEPVTIHARGDSAEIDTFAASIDAALAEIARRLELSIPAHRLEVYFFDSSWQMRSFLREHCPEQSGKAAACFSRPEGFAITVVKSSQPGKADRMLRHELSHYLLASHYRELPRWIDEGLAQYMEDTSTMYRDEKRKAFVKGTIPRTVAAITELISLPSSQVLSMNQYLLSWVVVSFVMQDRGMGLASIKNFLAFVESDNKNTPNHDFIFGSLKDFGTSWDSFLLREHLM